MLFIVYEGNAQQISLVCSYSGTVEVIGEQYARQQTSSIFMLTPND